MVFQHFDLFNNKTALENVTEAPVVVNRKSKRAATLRARELLTTVGVAEKERSYPTQMSGGQQQRVAIARALAMEPQLLLLDEPTSALDPELVGGVLEIVGELAASGVTMILVTHEIGFAREVCDRVAFMDEGFIVESGIAQQVFTEPANPRTRAFLGKLL
jgi:polar amino acid transport system ATP-binding protein